MTIKLQTISSLNQFQLVGSWEGRWGEKVVLGNVENMYGLGKMTNNAKGGI